MHDSHINSFLVSFGDISEVPFPSISICHPKSWKWPGLVKAITHYDYLGDAFFIIKKRRESESESSAEGYAEGQPKSEAAGDDV